MGQCTVRGRLDAGRIQQHHPHFVVCTRAINRSPLFIVKQKSDHFILIGKRGLFLNESQIITIKGVHSLQLLQDVGQCNPITNGGRFRIVTITGFPKKDDVIGLFHACR